jgi:hypothetical protein
MKKLIVCLLLILIPYNVFAACTGESPTWTTTPDYTSVAACVAGATAGDTINVSAGDGSETWSSTLSIDKNIHLVGPGMDSLVITIGTLGYNTVITTSVLTEGSISGFEFLTSAALSAIQIRGTGWRVHHNRYRNTLESGTNGLFIIATGLTQSLLLKVL